MKIECTSCGRVQKTDGEIFQCCESPSLFCKIEGNDGRMHSLPYKKFLAYERIGKYRDGILNIYQERGKWVKYQCVHCGAQINAEPDSNLQCEHKTNSKNPKSYFYPFSVVGFDEDQAPEELKKIVNSPNYGEQLVKELSKRIVGEDKIKKVLVNNLCGGRLVKNSQTTSYNVLLSEVSGTGKDHTAKNTLQMLPNCFWDHKTRLSEKALSYWHPSQKEPYYTWNWRILYCEDSTDHFLNSDTVKVMMTGGSDITVVDKGESKSIKVNGTPIFLVTSATAEPSKELNRRISSLELDSSEEQTARILEFQSKVAIEGLPKYDANLILSAYLLKRVHVEVPFAKSLLESFPKNLQSRTNFDRLLDLIKASAALHQYSRIWNNEETIQANKQDLDTGLEIFKWLYPSRNTSLTHAQQKLASYMEQVCLSKSAAELFREAGHFYYSQIGKMIDGLRSLANKGFVSITEGERNGRVCDLYTFIPEINVTNIVVSNVSIVSKVSKVSKVSRERNDKNELTKLTPLTPNTSDTQLTDASDQTCVNCKAPNASFMSAVGWLCKKCAYLEASP